MKIFPASPRIQTADYLMSIQGYAQYFQLIDGQDGLFSLIKLSM